MAHSIKRNWKILLLSIWAAVLWWAFLKLRPFVMADSIFSVSPAALMTFQTGPWTGVKGDPMYAAHVNAIRNIDKIYIMHKLQFRQERWEDGTIHPVTNSIVIHIRPVPTVIFALGSAFFVILTGRGPKYLNASVLNSSSNAEPVLESRVLPPKEFAGRIDYFSEPTLPNSSLTVFVVICTFISVTCSVISLFTPYAGVLCSSSFAIIAIILIQYDMWRNHNATQILTICQLFSAVSLLWCQFVVGIYIA